MVVFPERRPPRILVAEDEPLLRWSLCDDLRAAGFVVIEARDATEALNVLAVRRDISVLVTDLNMPGPLDGRGLAEKARVSHPEIVIILSTAEPVTHGDHGSDWTAIKPYDGRLLIRAINHLLDQRNRSL